MPRPDTTMLPEVRAEFLRTERTLRLATLDGDGWPAVVPLWFVHHPDARGELWVWNLNRSRRTERLVVPGPCGVTIDAGHDYQELRGLTARATPCRVDDDAAPEAVRILYARKYFGSSDPLPAADHHTWFALTLTVERSWDFRRLAG